MELINGLLKLPREQTINDKPVMPMHRVTSIVCKDVNFSYQGQEEPQLQIPFLEFKGGERIALLGAIGSGKSTLIKVLAKLYKPSNGTVKFDGIDLWQIDEYFMNTNVGYHSQNPELFKGTLKDNLLFGRGLSDKHLVSIVNDLGIDRIADQSGKGLDRPISEGGAGLSGGQRQIISLGRVLMGGKNIWLFDEPTAALDNHSQERFLSALRSRMRSDDILIFSTHNIKLAMELSTRIIVMDNGKISKDAPTNSVQVKKSA
jgi:ATP-binding cassette subfamily C protein LapB